MPADSLALMKICVECAQDADCGDDRRCVGISCRKPMREALSFIVAPQFEQRSSLWKPPITKMAAMPKLESRARGSRQAHRPGARGPSSGRVSEGRRRALAVAWARARLRRARRRGHGAILLSAAHVAERGLNHFELSLRAQYELTKRFTAEGSIRAYIAADPERTFATLSVWAKDENPHVRRLVSEGTRLRLPWASRVAWLDENPARVLALLEVLKDDPAPLVRRSIANNLNDLGKEYPDLVVETCQRWSQAASPEVGALIRHALRSLVKKGHRGALALLGASARPRVVLGRARLSAKSVRLGGALRFSFSLESSVARTQVLVVDYAVTFVKAKGAPQPKVFKLRRITLEANGSAAFEGKISFARMTTRRHYPGRHRIEVLVNGVAHRLGDFEVRPS